MFQMANSKKGKVRMARQAASALKMESATGKRRRPQRNWMMMTLTSSRRILARPSSEGKDSKKFLRKKLLTRAMLQMSNMAIQMMRMHSFSQIRNAKLSMRMTR